MKIHNLLFFFLIIFFLSSCSTIDHTTFLHSQPTSIKQILIVQPKAKSQAIVSAYERNNNNQWINKFHVPAVVGRSGVFPSEEKKEGDGATPSGLYPIVRAFGYADKSSVKLTYQQVTDKDIWIDDVASPLYNMMTTLPTEAKSFETLKRSDDLYKNVIVIEYNTNPIVSGKGSAIFLHIWRSSKSPTSGCVAVSEKSMKRILAWLDTSKSPHIFINQFCGC